MLKNKKQINTITSGLLILMVVFEVLSLIWLNLFPKEIFMDQDYAKIIRHIIEIGDKRQIFLPHWDYLTTGEFDCAAPMAVLVYLLTGNIHFAFGISNLFNVVVWGIVIFRLLGATQSGLNYKLLALAVVILPYDFGMLSYTNMMFFCGGQYVYKSLVSVLFVLALVIPAREWKKVKNIIVYILLIFLAFLTALSGGLYVLICGIFPVLICLLVTGLSGKEKNNVRYHAIVAGLTVIAAMVGVKMCKLTGIAPHSADMNIRSTSNYVDVANEIINNFIRLFNPFFKAGVPATSFDGIVACLKWLIIILFFMGLVYIPKVFGLYLCTKSEDDSALTTRDFVTMALISVFVWNVFIMFMTVSSPRYHLIGAISLMLVAIIALEKILDSSNDRMRFLTQLMLGVGICMITVSSIFVESDEYFNGVNEYYVLSKAQCEKLIDYLEENDIGTVFFVDNYEIPELLRAIDKNRVYETYVSEDGSVINYDYYVSERDHSAFSDRNIILVKEETIKNLPIYITENYKKIDSFGGFDVFESDNNPIDGVSLVAKDLKTIDLATTPGYEYVGEIDGNGWLHATDEGEVLKSALIESNNPFTLTVYYSLEVGAGATLKQYEYFDSETIVERNTYELSPELDSIKINIEFSSRYIFSIEKEDSGEMVIKELIFD